MSRAPGYPETVAPALITDKKPRCQSCGKVIAWFVTRPWSLQCRHCRVTNRSQGFSEDQIST